MRPRRSSDGCRPSTGSAWCRSPPTADVAVPPTTDHALVIDSIMRLEPGGATAIGDAMVTSTEASQRLIGEWVAGASAASGAGTGSGNALRADPVPDGAAERRRQLSRHPGGGGHRSRGPRRRAGLDHRLRDRHRRPARPARAGRPRDVADDRGRDRRSGLPGRERPGAAPRVYRDLGSSLGYRIERHEVTSWAVGLGLLAGLLAATASLRFTGRLP